MLTAIRLAHGFVLLRIPTVGYEMKQEGSRWAAEGRYMARRGSGYPDEDHPKARPRTCSGSRAARYHFSDALVYALDVETR